jgi:hypothetical protein
MRNGRSASLGHAGLLPVAGLVAALVAACGAAGSAPPTTPGPTASGPATPASSPVRIDVKATTPDGGTLTVHGSGVSGRRSMPPAGTAWYNVVVEFCAPPSAQALVPVATVRGELVLALKDGRQVAPDAGPGAPEEAFMTDQSVKASECVRGPVLFAVPLDGIPEYLVLTGPSGGMRWRVT